MNKKVIIISVLGLVGIGAFFYFKPKNEAKDKGSSTGGSLSSASDNPSLPSNTTTSTSTTPTSTLSAPPTQTSVTINDVVLTTPAQVVETAFKISEAKSIASQIFDLRNKKNRWANLSMRDYATESGKQFWIGKRDGDKMLELLKNTSLADIDNQIKALNNTLALLGYMEVNGSITKI
jgi:hypothetical protein